MNKKGSKLAEFTIDELIIKRKKIIGAAMALCIVSIIALLIIFYIAFTKKKYGLLGFTAGICVAFFIILTSLNQIDKEISLRKQNDKG